MRILDLRFRFSELDKLRQEDEELFDLMVRSAASYAMNREVFRMECSQKLLFPLLESFGFTTFEDKRVLDITKIIGKCHQCQ